MKKDQYDHQRKVSINKAELYLGIALALNGANLFACGNAMGLAFGIAGVYLTASRQTVLAELESELEKKLENKDEN